MAITFVIIASFCRLDKKFFHFHNTGYPNKNCAFSYICRNYKSLPILHTLTRKILVLIFGFFLQNSVSSQCDEPLTPYCQGVLDELSLEFEIPDQTCVDEDCFPVSVNVDGFNDIILFQFTLSFDPTVFEFDQYIDSGSLIGPISTNTVQSETGNLFFLWNNYNGEGETHPPGTELFTIILCPTGEPGESSEFILTENINEIEIQHESATGDVCLFCDEQINNSGGIITLTNPLEIDCCEFYASYEACNNADGTANIAISFCGGVGPIDVTLEAFNNVGNTQMGTAASIDDILTFTNVGQDDYVLRATDGNGAFFEFPAFPDFLSLGGGDVLDVSLSISDPPRCWYSGGDIGLDINGGTGHPYEIEFSNNYFTTLDISAPTPNQFILEDASQGTYVVTVTDNGGCTATDMISMEIPPLVIQIVSQTDAFCLGSNDGSITITASGGTPFPGGEYEFAGQLGSQWTDNTLDPRDYNDFIVIDANGCREEIEFTIGTQNPNIDLEVPTVITPVPCNGGIAEIQINTGSLAINPMISIENADEEEITDFGLDGNGNIIFTGDQRITSRYL